MNVGAPPRTALRDEAVVARTDRHRDRRLSWGLAGVCALVTLLHVLVADLGRGLSWDEAIYVSQVRPDVEAIHFSAQRARGITYVVAPSALLSLDVVWVRAWLALVGGVALWAAFLPWIRITAGATLLAAAGYATTWFALVSQSEIYPNTLTALGILAATGWALRAVSPAGGRGALVALAAAVAFTALMRPTDSVIAGAAIALALVGAGRRWLPVIGAMATGGLVGMAPWLVESVERYGGVRNRLEALARSTAGADVEGGPVWRQYLDLLNGPLQGPIDDPQISTFAVLWVATVLLLVAAGWIAARATGRLRLAVTTTLVAGAMAATYVLGTEHTYLRFLLPAWAVLCPLMAVGAWRILQLLGPVGPPAAERRGPRPMRLAVSAALGLLVGAWLVAQVTLTARTSADLAGSRASAEVLGQVISQRTGGESCAVSSEYAWPQIVFYSGCDGERLLLDDEVPFADADHRHVYALSKSQPPSGSPLHSWRAEQVEQQGAQGWMLYTRPQEAS